MNAATIRTALCACFALALPAAAQSVSVAVTVPCPTDFVTLTVTRCGTFAVLLSDVIFDPCPSGRVKFVVPPGIAPCEIRITPYVFGPGFGLASGPSTFVGVGCP
jgi:hypothetical protein